MRGLEARHKHSSCRNKASQLVDRDQPLSRSAEGSPGAGTAPSPLSRVTAAVSEARRPRSWTMPAGKRSLARARCQPAGCLQIPAGRGAELHPILAPAASCSAGRGKYKQRRSGRAGMLPLDAPCRGAEAARGEFGLFSLAQPCLCAGVTSAPC